MLVRVVAVLVRVVAARIANTASIRAGTGIIAASSKREYGAFGRRALVAMVALARERGDGEQSDMAYLPNGARRGMVSGVLACDWKGGGASRRRGGRTATPKCTAWTRRSDRRSTQARGTWARRPRGKGGERERSGVGWVAVACPFL